MPQGSRWTRVTIHCSDTPNGKDYSTETIRAFHKSKGWADIGYHKVIQPSGQVDHGRSLNQIGSHVAGANSVNQGVNIGICLIGKDKFTQKQFDALRSELDFFTQSVPKYEIMCHYEYDSARRQGKSCPNMEVRKLLYWYYTCDQRGIVDYLLK